MAVLAPMPRAMMSMAVRAKAGLFLRSLRANFRLWMSAGMVRSSVGEGAIFVPDCLGRRGLESMGVGWACVHCCERMSGCGQRVAWGEAVSELDQRLMRSVFSRSVLQFFGWRGSVDQYGRQHTPGAKAPLLSACERGPSLKAWRTWKQRRGYVQQRARGADGTAERSHRWRLSRCA